MPNGWATNQMALLKNVIPENIDETWYPRLQASLSKRDNTTANKLAKNIPAGIHELCQDTPTHDKFCLLFTNYTSDIVGNWASYLLGLNDQLSLEERLNALTRALQERGKTVAGRGYGRLSRGRPLSGSMWEGCAEPLRRRLLS